jgi:hypothetical protein
MTKRTVFILWIIAIILGGAVASLKLSQNHATESATKRQRGQKLFDNFPAADVASVTIDGAGTSVHLAKKNNSWVVGEREDYPANAATVNEFLRTLGELKVSQGIEAGPSLARRFGMDAQTSAKDDRGLTVTFKDASGKDLAAVSFGKSTSSAGAEENPMMGGATGRFVRNHSDESGIYVVNQAFPTLTDDAKRWLKEDFVQIEKIKSVSITRPGNADIAWKLTRDAEEGEFKLDGAKDKETLDPTATSPLKSLFSYARFDDVLPAAKAQEASKADEKRTVAIETFEGFNYNFTIAPKKTDPKTDVPKDKSDEQAAGGETYLLTVTVKARIPQERKKEANEKPEDAKAKDAAFQERHKALTEKLAKEEALAGHVYEVSKWTVESLLKDRAALIKKDAPSATPEANQATPPAALAAPMPNEPVEAVTPPVSAPEDPKANQ